MGGEKEEGVQYMTVAMVNGYVSGDSEGAVVVECMEVS